MSTFSLTKQYWIVLNQVLKEAAYMFMILEVR